MPGKSLSSLINHLKHSLVALLFMGTQIVFPLVLGGLAHATSANYLNVSKHQGQLSNGNWSNGNITTYRAGDSINFRFTLDSSQAASGHMLVNFTDSGGGCTFFTNSFILGASTTNSGATPLVTTFGSASAITSGPLKGDWGQALAVTFAGAGEVVVNYILKLSTDAGNCNGSSQHSQLNNVSDGTSGDFANIGSLSVPVPANGILPYPTLTTQTSSASVYAGSSVTDTATLIGSNKFTPLSGTVSFYVCYSATSNPDCSSGGTQVGSAVALSPDTGYGGTATSAGYTVAAIGYYCFQAQYTPDSGSQYSPVSETNQSSTAPNNECFSVSNIPTGTITLIKNVSNTHGGTAGANDFGLTIGDTPVTSGQTVTLAPGSYSINEAGETGYQFVGITGTNCPSSLGGNVVLVSNENVTCTITNADIAPSLTVVKNVVNDNGGTTVADKFTMRVNGAALTNGKLSNSSLTDTYTYSNPVAGTSYAVTEDNFSGYASGGFSCVDNTTKQSVNNPVTLSLGQNVTCSVTNNDIAPTLTLTKYVTGGTATAANWTLYATPATNSHSTLSGAGGFTSQTAWANDTYTLSESTGPTGYSASSWNCTGSGGHLSGNALTLDPGANVSCSITNTRDTGTITVNKTLLPSNDSGKFNLNINGTPYISNVGDGGTTGAKTVDTGNYTVSETAGTSTDLSSYSTSYSCYDGDNQVAAGNTTSSTQFTVSKGHNIVCTFTNTRYGSITAYKYNVNSNATSGDGTGTGVPNWNIYLLVNGTLKASRHTDSNGQFTFGNLLPDNYTLVECQNVSDGCSTWTQIYGPAGIKLSPGQNSTGNDFGNFQNASISGYKFNDLNGDGLWNRLSEPTIGNWTINLYNGTKTNGKADATTTTDNTTGKYTFTNLGPGIYTICEDVNSQTGYLQTFPVTSNGCYTVAVNLSGHEYVNNNFGNQGQGTLTTIKNVDNGTGKPTPDSTDWRWAYSGTFTSNSNLSTGSKNNISVPADTYTITETQKTGYHFSSVACKDNNKTVTVTQAEATTVTVAPGNNVVCTYTNTRDTGSITVNKVVNPSNDNGRFNLSINGPDDYNFTKKNQKDGGSTGAQTVVTGSYTVSETAANKNTDMSDYTSVWRCSNDTSGTGTTSSSFTVASGEDITCTFTNTKLAKLTIVKDANPHSEQSFTFRFGSYQVEDIDSLIHANSNADTTFSLTDNGGPKKDHSRQITGIIPGDYYVSEDQVTGWDLEKITCTNDLKPERIGNKIIFALNAGDDITCTFHNVERGGITIVKNVDSVNSKATSQSFNFNITNGKKFNQNFTLTGEDGSNTQSYDNLKIGRSYTISEQEPSASWQLEYAYCYNDTTESFISSEPDFSTNSISVKFKPGNHITCYFTNEEKTTVIVTKYNDYNQNGTQDSNEPPLPGWNMNLTEYESGSGGTTQTTGTDGTTTFSDLNPYDVYNLSETLQTGWAQSRITCDSPSSEGDGLNNDSVRIFDQGNNYQIFTSPGATVHCFVGNYRNTTVLNLVKSNNKPLPTAAGSTVEYTLSVTVPQDSGAVFNAQVTDLPPKGFTYVQNSWTAHSSNAVHDAIIHDQVFNGSLDDGGSGNPTYGSPGTWHIGTLLPGETVNLTYLASISNTEVPGTYPDLAFALGFTSPALAHQVFSNLSTSTATNPFVSTSVTIAAPPQILGVQQILVNTGSAPLWAQYVLPIVLVLTVVIVRRLDNQKGIK